MNDLLLSPYQLSSLITVKNRIVMAPMTRVKATDDYIPTEAMSDYYARRADSGLIITEGTIIKHDARGQNNVPGIFSEKQIQHWQRVTEKVHHRGGLIFSQIWHVGRVSHPDLLDGHLPISASETQMKGRLRRSNGLMLSVSRAATLSEIQQLISDYQKAAENAIQSGFDGIEIHGANGYLVDQFLHYDTNHRTDEYGNSTENRARFALEIIHACGQAIGYERVGIRLSPGAYLNEIVGDNRDYHVFKYLLSQLNKLNIAYVHTGNFDDTKQFSELNHKTMSQFLRDHYIGTVIACGGYTFDSALTGIMNNQFNLVAMGRPFIANPDLIEKYKKRIVIKQYDESMLNTLY